MKLIVWTAQNKQGEFLCRGNMNARLSYHLCYPFDCNYLCGERWLMCRTKWEIESHIKRWNSELNTDTGKRAFEWLAKKARCQPVKIIVSWEPATKGGDK